MLFASLSIALPIGLEPFQHWRIIRCSSYISLCRFPTSCLYITIKTSHPLESILPKDQAVPATLGKVSPHLHRVILFQYIYYIIYMILVNSKITFISYMCYFFNFLHKFHSNYDIDNISYQHPNKYYQYTVNFSLKFISVFLVFLVLFFKQTLVQLSVRW